eukprot:gene4869-34630_t
MHRLSISPSSASVRCTRPCPRGSALPGLGVAPRGALPTRSLTRMSAATEAKPAPDSTTTAIVKAPSKNPANRAVLESFFYGRALAMVWAERTVQFVLDASTDFPKALSEQPSIMAEFQNEVTTLARRDMAESTGTEMSESATSSSGRSSSSKKAKADAESDMQAIVDELRAEIATTRAVLQQIRSERTA